MQWLPDEPNPSTRSGVLAREFTLDGPTRPVTGVVWQAENPQPGAPLICLGHGASGDRHQRPIPALAGRLVADGAHCLAIDGPVHGRRLVEPGGREAMGAEWNRPGNVDDMTADWRAAIDAVQALPELGAGPVGYWGLSMGTIYGAPLVAADDRITVAVLGLMGIAGPSSYKPIIRAAAEAITCPVLFITQLEDELFTREQALELFDALASTDKRLHANPGLHPEVPAEELRHSQAFLMSNLRNETEARDGIFPGAG